MREARVIALSGVLQACRLVRDVATHGRADSAYIEASLSSVFRIDADSAAAVFGGLNGVRMGLETLHAQFEGGERDIMLARLATSALRLERQLMRRSKLVHELRQSIQNIQRQVDHFGIGHESVQARLAEVYVTTLSQLQPRVIVHGNPLYRSNPRCVEQIRALLLAAVRAAVLWRQVGGSQWRLLLRGREYAMLARGLLSRSMLDQG
jgi:high frequency lysogenization protein